MLVHATKHEHNIHRADVVKTMFKSRLTEAVSAWPYGQLVASCADKQGLLSQLCVCVCVCGT